MVSGQRDSEIKVLDHGYVKLIEFWGSDERIIEAARMSTAKGFQGWGLKHTRECEILMARASSPGTPCSCAHDIPGDEKLLAYLWRNKHHTPFEMAGMTIEVQAPIFVFREWHRHRTQSYNELSARYTPLPDVNYVPTVERLLLDGGTNKQAKGVDGRMLTAESAEVIQQIITALYRDTQQIYQHALDIGVPKELARLMVPVGRYSRMRASANLRNWLLFLTLRMDEHAQWEIRQYANVVATLVAREFPRTHVLFTEQRT